MKIKEEDLHFLNGIQPDKIDTFISDLKKQIRNGSVKNEEDAANVAKKYLKEDAQSYHPTLALVPLLHRKVKKIVAEKKYKHRWFKGKVKYMVYYDVWGRLYSKTTGVIADGIPTQVIRKDYTIKALGGAMWRSKNGRTFICEYRTDLKEIENATRPETFIG
jgi:hypothetical protein